FAQPGEFDHLEKKVDEWLQIRKREEANTGSKGTHTEWLFRALADRDLSRAVPGTEAPELLGELLSQLLESREPDLASRLIEFMRRSRNRADLIQLLPERLLARLIMYAVPQVGRELLQAGELLAEAAGTAGHPLGRAALWEALLMTAAAPI